VADRTVAGQAAPQLLLSQVPEPCWVTPQERLLPRPDRSAGFLYSQQWGTLQSFLNGRRVLVPAQAPVIAVRLQESELSHPAARAQGVVARVEGPAAADSRIADVQAPEQFPGQAVLPGVELAVARPDPPRASAPSLAPDLAFVALAGVEAVVFAAVVAAVMTLAPLAGCSESARADS
jgi:hypothetical protein